MFDLETAIRSWRHTFLEREGTRAEQADELEDHLRQEHERLRIPKRGDTALLSEEEAFLIAARRLGSTEALAHEFGRSNPGAVWRRRWIWMLTGYLGLRLADGLISATGALTLAAANRSTLNGAIALYFLVLLAGAAGAIVLARFVARAEMRVPARLALRLRSTSGLVSIALVAIATTAAVSILPGVLVARYAGPSVFGLMDSSVPRWMVLAWARTALQVVPFLALAWLLWRERARLVGELPAAR